MLNQRDAFFNVLKEERKTNNKIVIISVDMGAASLNEIKNENWYILTAPTEQLAITMAIGLAHKGFKPYVYGIASFIAMRAFEQINILCSQNLPVTIVGVGASLSYDLAGVTHHAISDLNALRCLPNMTIINCSSVDTAEYYAFRSLMYETPLYIRLDKNVSHFPWAFDDHCGIIMRKAPRKFNTVISTGEICNFLQAELPDDCGLIEIFKFPFDPEPLETYIKCNCYNLISVEENYIVGGLGECLCSLGLKVKKIGLSDFCEAKPRKEYWNYLLQEVKNVI